MAVRTIEQIKSTLSEYAILVNNKGLPLEKIILFGSYSSGKQNDDSDIDIAVILRKYDKDKFTTRLELMKLGRKFEEVIEPHPFLTNEFDESDPFASEIIKTGIEVYS